MPDPASPLTDQFASLLARMPADLDLDRLALEHKAIQRCRKIKSGDVLLRLALAHGPGGFSLRDAAGWAGVMGLAEITNPSLKYRLDAAGDFLAAVVASLLAARASSKSLHWPGRTLRVADGSSISLPRSQGTDWRVHGVFDLAQGGFSHLELTDASGGESLCRGAPVPGEVRIADRGYGHAKAWQAFYRDGGGKADLIVRLRWNSFSLSLPDAAPFDVITYLDGLPDDGQPHEIDVRAYLDRHDSVPVRLIVLRKPPEAVQAAMASLQARARRKNHAIDPRSLVAAQFIVLGTSLPREAYAASDILAAYRLRWQVELAFKRLKSLLHIDKLKIRSGSGARSWLHAHLILALLCDELSQDVLESFPSGPC